MGIAIIVVLLLFLLAVVVSYFNKDTHVANEADLEEVDIDDVPDSGEE